MGIQMVQLGYFAISPPTMIAIPSFEQVRVRELLETTCCVESRGNLVGNRFIVNKTVCVRRADRLFIEGFGIYHPVFDSRDFGADQCGAVFKILCATLRPHFEHLVVCRERVKMFPLLIMLSTLPTGRVREGTVIVELHSFELRRRCPGDSLRLDCSLNCGFVIAREEASLRLP